MPGGRPSLYTSELCKEICDKIATSSKGLPSLCKQNPNWPTTETIYSWLAKYKEFSDMYARSKRLQIEVLVNDVLEISDDSSYDKCVNDSGKVITDTDHINRSRLRVDSRKWLAAKLVPRLYGDNAGLAELHEEIAQLKRELEAKGASNNGGQEMDSKSD